MLKILILPVLALLAWAWNLDVVDAHYATRAELDANDCGWLPPILPGSAHDIRTVNNLDLNLSRGAFEFSDTDAGAFFARLSLDVPSRAPYADWSDTLAQYRASGHVAWTYSEDGVTWVFFCDPSEDACDYRMWMPPARERTRLASTKQAHARHGP